MNHHFIKCSKFTKDSNIKIKCKKGWKINFYSHFVHCDFEKFETIDKEKLSDL